MKITDKILSPWVLLIAAIVVGVIGGFMKYDASDVLLCLSPALVALAFLRTAYLDITRR